MSVILYLKVLILLGAFIFTIFIIAAIIVNRKAQKTKGLKILECKVYNFSMYDKNKSQRKPGTLRQLLESHTGKLTDEAFRTVCNMVTKDIKANKLLFSRRTSLSYVVDVAAICTKIVSTRRMIIEGEVNSR
jgi:hypothetical protein